MKDWIGNRASGFAQLGASNHSDVERAENDFYATDPESVKLFLQTLERDNLTLKHNIWECACGQGHISKVLEEQGYDVYSTDLVDRGYGKSGIDFLKSVPDSWWGDIVTNPPYKYAKEFVEKGLEVCRTNAYIVMYLKIQFLEGQKRSEMFKKFPPKYIYVNSIRQTCYINGDMSKKLQSATCFCWFIWQKGFSGEPIVRWII